MKRAVSIIMFPTDWLALIVFFAVSYTQLFIFYIHAYGVTGGWTTVLDSYNENVRLLGLPDFVLLIYFTLCISLKATAAFLVWKAVNDVVGTVAYNETDINAIGALFFIDIFLVVAWTKSFFTPPKPYFVAALIFGGLEAVVSVIALPYYYNAGTNKVMMVRYGHEDHIGFVLQFIYVLVYGCVITFCTFYGFFHSSDSSNKS